MIKGMTAYSIREKKFDSWEATVEFWSYNHKFLRIDLSIPSELRRHSKEIEKLIRGAISRGKINLSLKFSNINDSTDKIVRYNGALAEKIYRIGKKTKKENEDALQMRDILLIPGVLEISEKTPELSKHWPGIKKLIQKSFSDLIKAKQRQGREASKDLLKAISKIKSSLKKIKKTHKQDKIVFANNLKKKVKEISSLDVTEDELEEEAVNYVRNKDINEEITRIKSYLDLVAELLESKEAVGKKVDFVAQELLRETNTLGAKKNNVVIKKEVVEIKEKIEKIREHAQNIE